MEGLVRAGSFVDVFFFTWSKMYINQQSDQ